MLEKQASRSLTSSQRPLPLSPVRCICRHGQAVQALHQLWRTGRVPGHGLEGAAGYVGEGGLCFSA